MDKPEFPSKEVAADLTLNELMQAISMAGVWTEMYGGGGEWRFKLSAMGGLIVRYLWGEHRETPRAALDDACESWRKESDASDG